MLFQLVENKAQCNHKKYSVLYQLHLLELDIFHHLRKKKFIWQALFLPKDFTLAKLLSSNQLNSWQLLRFTTILEIMSYPITMDKSKCKSLLELSRMDLYHTSITPWSFKDYLKILKNCLSLDLLKLSLPIDFT